MQRGPCRAVSHQFYFNGKSGKCKRFRYGGCGGNENRFRNLHDCQKRCMTESSKCKGSKFTKKIWGHEIFKTYLYLSVDIVNIALLYTTLTLMDCGTSNTN